MKKSVFRFLFLFSLFQFIPCKSTFAFMCMYKEDFYRLYHINYQKTSDDCLENIWWLEKASKADFCNPRCAYAKIENEKQWEKYRYLFQMHINLKLIEQHIRLGSIYDKKVANFYDAPWKDEYLRNLDKCLSFYEAGLEYFKEAQIWAEKASVKDFTFLHISQLQEWEDERERIITGKLNYEKILKREIERVKQVQKTFIAMESKTY